MLPIRYQREPFSGEGARLYGGRWNAKGSHALYLSTDHATAVAEFYQGLAKPGTLAPYCLDAKHIADLTNGKGFARDARVQEALDANWKAIAVTGKQIPPGWVLADELIASGADGALLPSVQNREGTNLVLWRWHNADLGAGQGAALTLLDPQKALTSRN